MNKIDWNSQKELLEKYILIDKLSYEEIGRKFKVSGTTIKKQAKNIGIKLISRRKINVNETFNKGKHRKTPIICLNCGKEFYSCINSKYCCIKCQQDYQHKIGYQKLINGDISIMTAKYSPKAFKKDILKEQNGVCAICGIKPEWNNKPLIFILDHIDGRASNNQRNNLRCICPNCDSQLETYKSKNKNSDRMYYHLHRR